MAVVNGLEDAFPGGIAYVALAAARDPDQVTPGVARAIGFPRGERPRRPRVGETAR